MITCDKFLNCAKRLLRNRSVREEDSRSAISRAYYSLYHRTLLTTKNRYSFDLIQTIEKHKKRRLTPTERRQLSSLDPDFLKKMNFHQLLPLALSKMGERTKAVSFKNYRDLRNQADYDLRKNFGKRDAITLVNSIETLFNQVAVL